MLKLMLTHKLGLLGGGASVIPDTRTHDMTPTIVYPYAHIYTSTKPIAIPHSRAGGGKQEEVPAPVIRAPTLALSGLEDGCIATVIYDLTMGGDGERCVYCIWVCGWMV